jgi:hypothetical protein
MARRRWKKPVKRLDPERIMAGEGCPEHSKHNY